MNSLFIPEGYTPKLNRHDTQLAIDCAKQAFQKEFSTSLELRRVSAPLFVNSTSGMNDNLSGTERPVDFDIPAIGINAEIVHSLAKWKRVALKKYGFAVHEGLITDMNAIRRDEELDNLHSIYVDQWDWEKIINKEDRTTDYLKCVVTLIVNAVCNVNDKIKKKFPKLDTVISRDISFITAQQLEDLYPDLTPQERENEYTKEHKTVFIMQIGDKLNSGIPHGNRAPDYDDWSLNGDILVWNDVLGCAFELSSMGVRVDKESLESQLCKSGCEDRKSQPYHQMILNDELPLTIGGGIGQSRLCMLLLGCAHIGEVQSSLWDEETLSECKKHGIHLL
ncbi:MAG: aspartate--ammonia ligase [Clostridia bacterium]|nr:aspartate--ammonia ligase [Clostridia bacterium]